MKRQFCHVISSLHATWGQKKWVDRREDWDGRGEEILAVSDGISHMETVVEPFISLHCAPKLIINNAVVSPIDTACSCYCCNGMLLQPKRNYRSNNKTNNSNIDNKLRSIIGKGQHRLYFPFCLLVISECPITYFLLAASRAMPLDI